MYLFSFWCDIGAYVTFIIKRYLLTYLLRIDSSSSPVNTILTGVHQGSVLGPLLFVLFISSIANVINPGHAGNSNLVSFHQYVEGKLKSNVDFQCRSCLEGENGLFQSVLLKVVVIEPNVKL